LVDTAIDAIIKAAYTARTATVKSMSARRAFHPHPHRESASMRCRRARLIIDICAPLISGRSANRRQCGAASSQPYLTPARHPSLNSERMMLPFLRFALYADDS